MKKLLALFLACTMVLGLASCKEQDEEEKNTLTGTTNHKTIYLCSTFKERCQSDRMGRTRNPVNGLSVPWV